jgi:hypothetical protein
MTAMTLRGGIPSDYGPGAWGLDDKTGEWFDAQVNGHRDNYV